MLLIKFSLKSDNFQKPWNIILYMASSLQMLWRLFDFFRIHFFEYRIYDLDQLSPLYVLLWVHLQGWRIVHAGKGFGLLEKHHSWWNQANSVQVWLPHFSITIWFIKRIKFLQRDEIIEWEHDNSVYRKNVVIKYKEKFYISVAKNNAAIPDDFNYKMIYVCHKNFAYFSIFAL